MLISISAIGVIEISRRQHTGFLTHEILNQISDTTVPRIEKGSSLKK